MTVAIWIIAVCEVIRAVQNILQIELYRQNSKTIANTYRDAEREFSNMLEELREGDDEKCHC